LALAVQERLGHPESRWGNRSWQVEAVAASKRLNEKGPQKKARQISIWNGLLTLDPGR